MKVNNDTGHSKLGVDREEEPGHLHAEVRGSSDRCEYAGDQCFYPVYISIRSVAN